MKHIYAIIVLILMTSGAALAEAPGDSYSLLPESIAAREQMAAEKKTTTIFLEEKDPGRLIERINTTSSEYAQKGWSVFAITPYIKNSSNAGVFLTFQKKLVMK